MIATGDRSIGLRLDHRFCFGDFDSATFDSQSQGYPFAASSNMSKREQSWVVTRNSSCCKALFSGGSGP